MFCMNISESNVNQAVELLKVLINTPSISREEGDATDKLQLFIERGAPVQCEIHRHLNNLWCVAPGFDASRPTLMLDAHIDTVKPVSGWSKHPFTPIVEGDRIYGLGSNDDGASLVTFLQVFYKICQSKQSYNTIFVASAEEEVSGKNGIESVKKNAPAAAVENQTVEGYAEEKHPKFEMYTDKAGEFRFRLKATNGQIIATSEGYVAKNSCENGIASVKKNAMDAPIVEE